MISLWTALGRLGSTFQLGVRAEAEEEATHSRLIRLPPEIILMIANTLPTPSAACLALCSYRMKLLLGHSLWRTLRSETPDLRLTFLTCLAKDLPQYFVCQKCVCLHRLTAIKWPQIIKHYPHPRCTWRCSNYRVVPSRYQIMFPHIQVAMKQHRDETDIGFPIEAFQCLEIFHDETKQQISLSSIDAQIVSSELLVRSQSWILLPWSQRHELITELARYNFSCSVCIHTRLGHSCQNLIPDLVRSRLDDLVALGKCRAQIMQCPDCWIDYMLDAVDFGDRGFAVLTTRWANLGAGLDPTDAKWQSHNNIRMNRGVHRPHELGEIQKSFEHQTELPVKNLTADNERRLFTKQRNRLVHREPDGSVWRWDRGNRWYLAPSGPPVLTNWECLVGEKA